jgi:ketosteroid isomerase-like protein
MQALDVSRMTAVLVGAADPEVVVLEARIRAAQLAADVDELEALISEDLLFAGPDGQLGSKAQDLEAYAKGLVRFLSHEPEELRIRRIGSDTVVTSLAARLVVEALGEISKGTYRYTRIWAREHGGSWRIVGGHVSELARERHDEPSRGRSS